MFEWSPDFRTLIGGVGGVNVAFFETPLAGL
jgi:hypothetical protein